ncbi:MAG: hypothetical protein QHC79_09435 [Pseudosphingobacterium sp.]|nr:hypothetical protein [Pseudosphingobacterium sp.]
MSIRTEMEGFAIRLPTQPAFYYMDVFEANANDNMAYPQVQMLEVESGEFYFHPTSSGVFDRPNMFIRFLDKHDLDHTGVQRDAVIDEMKQLARMFVNMLNQSGNYDWIDRASYITVVNAYDTNVSGVEIRFKLIPIVPGGFCI